MAPSALVYHARTGTYERLSRGVYRLVDVPTRRDEALIAAVAALGSEAAISHESALALYEVCDVAPSHVHVTLPRSRRYRVRPASDVVIHTTTHLLHDNEQTQFDGFRATSLARTILDCSRTGTAPEQLYMALDESAQRGLLSAAEIGRITAALPRRLRRA